MTTILGIDPGTRHTGIARLEANGGDHPHLILETTLHAPSRLRGYDAVLWQVDQVRAHYLDPLPDLIALEWFSDTGRTISVAGQDINYLVAALGELRHQAPVMRLDYLDWRQGLIGRAPYSIAVAICIRLGIKAKGQRWDSEHSIDAAGIALVALDRWIFAQGVGH